MKIFTKTLLFFIGIIIFQSGLTIFFITNITKRNNLEDAVKQLKYEAGVVFDNYGSWKRGIWKSLLEIRSDSRISALLPDPQDISFSPAFTNALKEILQKSGVDLLVVKNALHGETDIITMTYNNFSLSELDVLERQKSHPYLELQMLGNQLCLIGITQLESSQEAASLDLFVIKRIDREFYKGLTLNRPVHTAFFLQHQFLGGTLDESVMMNIPRLQDLHTLAYDLYDIEMENTGFNIAVKNIETLQLVHSNPRLFLVTMLSNASYINRLTVLEKTVLYVTGLSALLSFVLGLFFSGNITQPVKNLLAAMKRIRIGQYDTTIDTLQSRNEIGELVQGFNEMARQIRQDKEKMEQYIHEITLLKDYNETIIQSLRAGILIVNHHLVVEKVNTSFLEYFHLEEQKIMGESLNQLQLDIFEEDLLNQMQAILRKEKDEYAKTLRVNRNTVYDIKLYPVDYPDEEDPGVRETVECVVVVEDISRKIEFEEKIFQAEKLSSISMLSAGVAHEINNPLGSIMTNVQNLLEEEHDKEKCVALRWIEQETRRIAKIVQELLNFSSSDLDRSRGISVNEVIGETIRIITYSLKKDQEIRLTTAFAENLPLAAVAQDELKQIVINLVKNSIQAIDRKGEILVTTRENMEDRTIEMLVEDNGAGIPEESISRIFDPFYTTKANGEGTGLGLSIVYGIINKYKGTIEVSSQEGRGTRIQVAFPVYQ